MRHETDRNHLRRQRSYELFDRIERRRDERASEQIKRNRAEKETLEKPKSKRALSGDADEVRFGALMPAKHLAMDYVERGGNEKTVWDAILQSLMAGFFKRGRRLFLIDEKIKSLEAEGYPEVPFFMRSPHFKRPKGPSPERTPLVDTTLLPDLLRQTWATVSTWKVMCELRHIPLPPSWENASRRHDAFLTSFTHPREADPPAAHNEAVEQAPTTEQAKAPKLPRATEEKAEAILRAYNGGLLTTKNAHKIINDQGLYYPQNLSEKLATKVTGRSGGRPTKKTS